jgi:hypothetical protein
MKMGPKELKGEDVDWTHLPQYTDQRKTPPDEGNKSRASWNTEDILLC